MKKALVILTVLLLGLYSCDKNEVNFTTGLNSKVYVGEGGCMPAVVESTRKYNNYSGKVYIVNKRDYDNLTNIYANCNCLSPKLDSLKSNSIIINIKNGNLNRELQPDSFLIMIDNQNFYCYDNAIYVKKDEVINKSFFFFHCTSY
jgi:hypothetical protein